MLSRSARITLLLFIDVVFFFIELVVGQYPCIRSRIHYTHIPSHLGYAVGSLALVADSFHMLKYASMVLSIRMLLMSLIAM